MENKRRHRSGASPPKFRNTKSIGIRRPPELRIPVTIVQTSRYIRGVFRRFHSVFQTGRKRQLHRITRLLGRKKTFGITDFFGDLIAKPRKFFEYLKDIRLVELRFFAVESCVRIP